MQARSHQPARAAREGLATGRPIVATAIGMEGLGLQPGVHYREANTAEAFAAELLKALAHPRSALEMGARGRAAAEDAFENGQLMAELLNFLEWLKE